MVERSTRRTWEQPVSFSLHPDDFRTDQDIKHDAGRFKYTEPKESTRRFSNQAEKDDMVDLLPVKTVAHEGHGYTKHEHHSHRNYDGEDSLVCAYCNQLYKKGD
ncbi:Hypothetical predicted protein [Paramuricea clavata]|uniref:Uncharacterized protein n=1 Tax=Paramuricea clavata TaxID=317549 RepID=A0A7D9LH77_PARCT|nr:Hypothetical predicted protein [Paramuricea clavata]